MTNPTTEPTHSVRERLARAAHAATNVGSDWPDIHEDRKKAWRKTADAILAELQEPSEGMRRIAATYLGFLPDESKGQGEAVRISMWRAMIQHIRGGGQ